MQIKAVNSISKNIDEVMVLIGKSGSQNVFSTKVPAEYVQAIKLFLKEQTGVSEHAKSFTLAVYKANKIIKLSLLGMGDVKALTEEKMRMLGGDAIRLCGAAEYNQPYVMMPDAVLKNLSFVKSFAEGMVLGSYKFDEYKENSSKSKIMAVNLFCDNLSKTRAAIKEAEIIGGSVNQTRDLINHPGNIVNPLKIAEEAKRVAKETGLSCKVLWQKDIERLKMGAFLSVTKGSDQPPCIIVLEHKGNAKSDSKTAFVGKGVTFDSGGISIKPSDGMGEMKDDMGGAAAVLYAMRAIAMLKIPANITAVIPCVENMPSGGASRPGDVVRSAAGKTIEIISTDAEGRLILADAVWYAQEKLKATSVIDIATLTGAASIALGEYVSGMVTNDQELCDKVMAASRSTGERCWQMPSYDEFNDYNKSEIADIKNSGGRFGGMITGGLFIGFFATKPWVHIDIGNTVTDRVTKGYKVKGPSGFGVRLLIETARTMM